MASKAKNLQNRDNFLPETKRRLAECVGHRCSEFPRWLNLEFNLNFRLIVPLAPGATTQENIDEEAETRRSAW